MPTTQSVLFPPPVRGTALSQSEQKYLATLQYVSPLRLGDTSAGPYSEALPPAGLNTTTGQSNQNQEIVYKKISADGSAWTVTGGAEGPQTLTKQYSWIRFKSDGTEWWVVGVFIPSGSVTPNESNNETPGGAAINGINTSFVLAHIPNPPGSLKLNSDGAWLASGIGFTLVGANLTLAYAPVSVLRAWYSF